MAEKSNVPYDTISISVTSQSIFSKCCGCIPIRTGCFILGYLNLVLTGFQTLALIALTTFIGVTTHGFDHLDVDREKPFSDSQINGQVFVRLDDKTDVFTEDMDHSLLTQIGFFLAVLLVANVAWLAINAACLYGLHKRRPGPIRVYVGFASARLLLTMVSFIYFVMSNRFTTQTIITHSIDIVVTAYFILVYYIYTIRLEREREEEIAKPAPINNVYLYPTKLDKSHLVA